MKLFGLSIKLFILFVFCSFALIKSLNIDSDDIARSYYDAEEEEDEFENDFDDGLNNEIDNADNAEEDDFLDEKTLNLNYDGDMNGAVRDDDKDI